jgi:hypothetical protein
MPRPALLAHVRLTRRAAQRRTPLRQLRQDHPLRRRARGRSDVPVARSDGSEA